MSGPLVFNPGRAAIEELEATFVGRGAQLDALVRDLQTDATGGTRRQWLLVAPRGCGKSHVTMLVSERLRRDHGWDVVRMPEEHYQVASVADLLEQIVARLNAGVSPFSQERDLLRVEERALDWLRARQKSTGRPLLVVLENLGMLFERQLRDRRAQARLRQILSVNPPFTLLATSTGYVAATTSHNAPFYDFFQHASLEDLSPDDARELVRARLTWDGPGGPEWRQVEPRVDALYHFAGGNPRLLLLLYAVLREGVSAELHAQLLKLLDEVSPYYQSRLKDISAQMERVLVELAIAGGPRTPSEIGQACRLPVNVVTANLSKLQGERLVLPGARKDGRSRRYELTDRLFRIWLQMREAHGGEQRLRFLVDFYRKWYEPEPAELDRLMGEAARHFRGAVGEGRELRCRDHLLQMDYLADAAHGDQALLMLVRTLGTDVEEALVSEDAEASLLRVMEATTDGRVRALMACVLAGWLQRQGRTDEALGILDATIDEATVETVEVVANGFYEVSQEEGADETLECLSALVERFPRAPLLLLVASWAARDANNHGLSITLLRRAREAGVCPHCADRGACDVVMQMSATSAPDRALVREALALRDGESRYFKREWNVATGLVEIREGADSNALLAALDAWRPDAPPGWIIERALCGVTHWKDAANAEKVVRLALSLEPPHSAVLFIDHLTEIAARSGTLSTDLIAWMKSHGDQGHVVRWFTALGPHLSRSEHTHVLEGYKLLRDAGLLPEDLPPYNSALAARADPSTLDALSPEEREAAVLLLGGGR